MSRSPALALLSTSTLLALSALTIGACMMKEPAALDADYDGIAQPVALEKETSASRADGGQGQSTDPSSVASTPSDDRDAEAGEEVAQATTTAAATRMPSADAPMGAAAPMPSPMQESKPKKTESRREAMMPASGRAAGGSVADFAEGESASGAGMPARPAILAPPTEPEPDPIYASGAEDYHDYGVNPFTMVSKDPLSTFSIDVDTASYSISRRKLEEGALPPQSSVRVEEFVNYFDFAYAQPTDDAPFRVDMEAMPDPFRSGHHILRVGVQGREVSRSERPAVHLTFLVDVSGSMSSPDKLGLAKKSMHLMVDGLREDDTVALATYAGRTAKILSPTSAANTAAIHSAIDKLESGGSTAMSSGIDMAYEMAWSSFKPGTENRVIVMSDGDANVGNSSWDDMLSQIKGYADRGVTLSTIGFGMGNYKDTLMEQLANKGDGNNYYIDGQAQAQRVFVEELGSTLITIARDVKIQVDFNPESVSAYRLIGYENRDVADKDFRNDKVDAGEIGSGHNVTALYDVMLRDGYTQKLATVRMRWEQPGADVDQGGSGATERAFTFQDRALKETPFLAGRDTRIAYASATFAEILRGSPYASEISLDALARFAEQSSRPGEKDDKELVGLMRKAQALGAGGIPVASK